MATKSISQLDTQATANETDLFEVAIVDANSASGYASKKESAAAIADAIVGEYQYPLRITGTTAKTIAGAINELKNLVDLLPQFAIEVVSSLPVSDISETTIYLVPAQDPEQGNYYEEYIYVNNAWELVGTTAVDLSGYYTSAQVDTLLAAKANTSSLATVATSGAYSDLSGKPTIDTALDDTSTNAVENRAVASEINSIKNEITIDGSASGDIATFVDGSDNPLKELKISIVAQQSGTGDPSPTNVRPISGYSTVDVTRCAKNLFDYNAITEISVGTTNRNGMYFNKAGTYSVSCQNSGNYCYCRVFNADGTTKTTYNIVSVNVITPATFSITNGEYFALYDAIANPNIDASKQNFAGWQAQVELSDSPTAYEPYNSETINIDWQDEAGTVYVGTLDVLTGMLSVNMVGVDLGDLSWTYDTANSIFKTDLLDAKNPPNNSTVILSLCEIYKSNSYNSVVHIATTDFVIGVSSTGKLAVKNSSYTDASDFEEAMRGVKYVYELATPIEYNLTPQQINSLLGTNNIFADCGSVTELKYTRDLNLCINDIISRIEALEGGSSNRSLSLSPVLTKSLTSDSDTTEGILEEETEEETKEEAQKNER